MYRYQIDCGNEVIWHSDQIKIRFSKKSTYLCFEEGDGLMGWKADNSYNQQKSLMKHFMT